MAVDRWLLTALATVAGGWFSGSPWPAVFAAVLAAGALRVARAASAGTLMLALGLFSASALRSVSAVEEYQREHHHVRQTLSSPTRCAAEVSVSSSPREVSSGISYLARVRALDCEAGRIEGPLLAQLRGGPDTLARGDRFSGILQVAAPEIWNNSEIAGALPYWVRSGAVLRGSVLAAEPVLVRSGLMGPMDDLRSRVRARIEATYKASASGMAKALVLGDSDLTEDERAAFRDSGLAHLLAVSGTHLIIAVLGVMKLFRYLLLRFYPGAAYRDTGRLVALFGLVLAPLYADFAGGSGSAWRAAWMLSAALFARALGRYPRTERSLAWSLWLGAGFDPLVAYDYSFLLSLAATTGILTVGRAWNGAIEREGPSGFPLIDLCYKASAITLASMLPCVPLLLLLAPSVSLAGIGANLLAAPLGEAVALPICLLHTLLASCRWLELLAAHVASGALICIKLVAFASAEVRWFVLELPTPTPWQLAALGGLLATAWAWWTVRGPELRFPPGTPFSGVHAPGSRVEWRQFGLGALAVLAVLVFVGSEVGARRFGEPQRFRVTVLDVGQGDSTLIDFPDGKLMLIDAGGSPQGGMDPGRAVVAPVLRMRRRDHLDVVVLSHPHPDHFQGLIEVAERVSVGEFWDTGQGEREGAGPEYAELLARLRARGTRVVRPSELCGTFSWGGVGVEVLAPCPEPVDGRGANDNSLVIRLTAANRRALFVGDAEEELEEWLLAHRSEALGADFLKVGHHGSRTSSSAEFVHAVHPQIATISCGSRNRFGHPDPDVVARLVRVGARVLRTDQVGSIVWQPEP